MEKDLLCIYNIYGNYDGIILFSGFNRGRRGRLFTFFASKSGLVLIFVFAFLLISISAGILLFWGVMILFTAAGCLIQVQILKKTEMGTKKRNKLSEALK